MITRADRRSRFARRDAIVRVANSETHTSSTRVRVTINREENDHHSVRAERLSIDDRSLKIFHPQ